MDEVISNINGANNLLCRYLEKNNEVILAVKNINQARHRLIYSRTQDNNVKYYYLLFKREPFFKADEELGTNGGYGESIDLEFLDFAISHNVNLIVICYINGFLYGLNPNEWKIKGKERVVEHIQDKKVINNQLQIINEKTVTISLHNLMRLNNEKEY